jgi:hypothetical protein
MALSARDLQQQNLREQALIAKEKRFKQANAAGNPAAVTRLSKKEGRNTANGGGTVQNHAISPYGGTPDPSVAVAPIAPDYYRNGYLKNQTVVDPFTLRERDIQYWNPIPRLVGERKKDTLASIKLIDISNINNADPNNPEPKKLIPEYSKFFLESVQEGEQEKVQIVETFNDFYSFFYGKKPPVYNFSGYLLNFVNYNWLNEFMYFYENFWRGTKAVERNARTFLTYNYQQVQGYILNVNANMQAATDKVVPFSISMLVTRRLIFSINGGYVSDSLIPRTETGFINTNADALAIKLTTEFLQGDTPADGNTTLDGSNRGDGSRTFDKSLDSSLKQDFGSFQKLPGLPAGSSNALNLKSGFGFA